MNIFREDLKRGLCTPVPWLALLPPLVIGIYSVWSESWQAIAVVGRQAADTSSVWEFILLLDFTPVKFMFPLLCLLPLGVAFCDEVQFGYSRFFATRSGVEKYLWSRIFSTALAGGLVLFLLESISAIYCLAVFKPYLAESHAVPYIDQWNMAYMFPQTGSALGFAFISYRIVLSFFFGCAWSVVGLAMSAIYPNRYVTLAGPFLLYFALFYLGQATGFRWVDPSEMVFPRFLSVLPAWMCNSLLIAEFITVFLTASLVFWYAGKRRLVDA